MNDLAFVLTPPVAALEAPGLFDWLSALFAAQPSIEMVASHRRGSGARWLDDLSAQPRFAAGVRRIRAGLGSGTSDTALTASLGQSFNRLFDGGAAPPYESAFRGEIPDRLFQAPTTEMEAMLAKHALSPADPALPADHLAVELALAGHLTSIGDPDAHVIIARLAQWVPDFIACCDARDAGDFWMGAAELLAAVLRSRLPPLSRFPGN